MKTTTFVRIIIVTLSILMVTGCSKEARKARFVREADQYFKAGNYDKAKVSYLKVIQLDPQSALAFERVGEMWLKEGAPFRSAPFLARASELEPNNVQNRLLLARSYLAGGQFANATKEALTVLAQVPDNGDAIVALAEAAQSKEDIEVAEEQLQKFPKKNDMSFNLASANLFFNSGDPGRAGSALQQALAADPKSPQVHLALGDLYVFQKDKERAGEEFKKAADLAPVRSMERLKYAAFKSANGETEEVRRIATEMTKQAPDYLPGWTLLAELALKDKKYDAALSLLENVFSRDPQYVDGRRLQANVFLAKGDNRKAIEVLERLDQTYSNSPLVKYELACAYLRNNNFNQAKAVLDQAVAINPNFTDAVLLLAEINLRSGHAETAIKPLTELLKRRPDLRSAALLLAAVYGALDRFDDAGAVLQAQAEVGPQDVQLQMALGLTYRQLKKYDEARRAFEKAAQLAPDDLVPVDRLIDLDLLDKRFDAARQRIRREFEKQPDSPAAHYFEGKILAAEGKWQAAQEELHKTLELNPNLVAAYDLLVQSYLATNKVPEAINELQAQLAKAPNNAQALLTLALLYEHSKDFPRARDAYEKLLAISPNYAPALNNLAFLDAEHLNDLDKAYQLARKARDLQPQDPAIGDTFGWVLYKRGDYKQALPILQESAQKTVDSPEIQFHLGMTAYMMGQADVAKIALKKAAEATKDFPSKDESKRRLSLLQGGSGLSVAQLEAMTKGQPNDVIAQMRLGEAYEKQGAADRASAAFKHALKISPTLVVALTKLAQLNAGPLNNKEQALAYAKKAREVAPEDPQTAALVGKVAYDSGNFIWSYSLLQEAVRQRQNDPAIRHDLAWAAYSMGKVNEAREAMQKVLTIGIDSSSVAAANEFLALTGLDENPKELMTAEAKVQERLKSNPQYVPALMDQAALDVQRGRIKQAIELYSDVLRRLPDFAPAQKHLAALYSQNPSNVAAAYELATKARKTLTDDPELADLLGRLSYEKKEYPRAIQLFQEGARKRPLDADSLFYLGMAQLQGNQKNEARGVLNQALTDGLQEPFATEAKRAIANLDRE